MIEAETIQELYANKSTWTQGSYGEDEEGTDFHKDEVSNNDRCVCFCLVGAVHKVYPVADHASIVGRLAGAIAVLYPKKFKNYLEVTIREWGSAKHDQEDLDEGVVIRWNDEHKRTIKDVRKVVKIARV